MIFPFPRCFFPGGSFIIDSNSFYENLNFHRIRTSMVRSSSEITPEDAGSHPDLSKFGYSQKEVWNWLYTEQDLNHNLRVVGGGPRPPKDSKVCTYFISIPKFEFSSDLTYVHANM